MSRMSRHTLRNVLDKMNSSDSDYRYMATSDLMQQLQNASLSADSDTQKRVCDLPFCFLARTRLRLLSRFVTNLSPPANNIVLACTVCNACPALQGSHEVVEGYK